MSLPIKHWLAKITVNALSLSASLNKDTTKSPRTISSRESYSAGAKYRISFSNLLPISPLIWTKYLFLPKKIWGTELRLLPKSFAANGTISGSRDSTINSVGTRSGSYSRHFKGKADWKLEPFKSLTGTYGFSSRRILYRPDQELMQFSFNPRKIKFGQETNFSQRLGARYTVPFFTFLSPNVTYNVDYKEVLDLNRLQSNKRKASVNSNWSASAKLDLKRLLGRKGGKKSTKKSKAKGPASSPKDGDVPPDSVDGSKARQKKSDAGGFSFRPHAPVVWLLRLVTSPLAPISATFKHGENRSAAGLKGRPRLMYRFGLSRITYQERDLGSISSRNRDSEKLSDNLNLKSKLSFFKLTAITASYDYRRSELSSATKTRQTSEIFPKMSTSIKKLDDIYLLKSIAPLRWVLKMTTASLNFTRTKSISEKEIIDTLTSNPRWDTLSTRTSLDLGGSLKLTQNFKNGWRLSADYGRKITVQVDEKFNPSSYLETQKSVQSISFSTNYSFRAPNGIRFPFLRKLRLKSTLNLNLSVKMDSNQSESRNTDGGGYTPKQDRSQLNVKIRANYSFSSSMKGGFDMNWTDTKDNLTSGHPTTHTRQVNIFIEFHF
jgi:hypothetical protein